MREVALLDLGRRPYAAVWELQRSLHCAVAEGRADDTWIVVEHDPVVTLGRNARDAKFISDRAALAARGIDVFAVERGGDVTYHGPGQLVVYPIMRLARFREVVPLVGRLEAAVIAALANAGIGAHGRREHRGIYVGERAICAVGLAVQRMTSLHGLALNAGIPLDYDRLITPCGTPQFGITSMSHELGRAVSWGQARDVLLPALEAAFDLRFSNHSMTAGHARAS